MSRSKRRQVAAETAAVLESGSYVAPAGHEVVIRDELQKACQATRLYSPEQLAGLAAAADTSSEYETEFEVVNTTTLGAVRQLAAEPTRDVLALNFASAKNPGGGFLNGSQAQEESLARASGLYACLQSQMTYYEQNRKAGTSLYLDYMIYSPRVPVFRDDDDQFLDEIYRASFITAPAPNAGAVRNNEPAKERQIEAVMKRRIEYVLTLCKHHGHSHLVLGAWGCGVFKNDPNQVAQWFHDALVDDSRFSKAFRRVVFAVLDNTPDEVIVRPFRERFASRV